MSNRNSSSNVPLDGCSTSLPSTITRVLQRPRLKIRGSAKEGKSHSSKALSAENLFTASELEAFAMVEALVKNVVEISRERVDDHHLTNAMRKLFNNWMILYGYIDCLKDIVHICEKLVVQDLWYTHEVNRFLLHEDDRVQVESHMDECMNAYQKLDEELSSVAQSFLSGSMSRDEMKITLEEFSCRYEDISMPYMDSFSQISEKLSAALQLHRNREDELRGGKYVSELRQLQTQIRDIATMLSSSDRVNPKLCNFPKEYLPAHYVEGHSTEDDHEDSNAGTSSSSESSSYSSEDIIAPSEEEIDEFTSDSIDDDFVVPTASFELDRQKAMTELIQTMGDFAVNEARPSHLPCLFDRLRRSLARLYDSIQPLCERVSKFVLRLRSAAERYFTKEYASMSKSARTRVSSTLFGALYHIIDSLPLEDVFAVVEDAVTLLDRSHRIHDALRYRIVSTELIIASMKKKFEYFEGHRALSSLHSDAIDDLIQRAHKIGIEFLEVESQWKRNLWLNVDPEISRASSQQLRNVMQEALLMSDEIDSMIKQTSSLQSLSPIVLEKVLLLLDSDPSNLVRLDASMLDDGVDSSNILLARSLSQSPTNSRKFTPPLAILTSGLLVRRQLRNYKNLEKISSRVVMGKLDGVKKAIKGFSLANESSMFVNEAWSLMQLKHSRICELECMFIDRDMLFIQMPYYENGTLGRYLTERLNAMDETRQLFQQLIQGIEYLHDNNLVHGNLNFSNVFVDGGGNIRIGGFDLSQWKNRIVSPTYSARISGVDDFIAPEIQQAVILQGNSSTADFVQPSCDIWAFGVMLYKALHRTIHRRDVSLTFANESSIHLNLNDFPGDVAPLLYSCLTLNPALRPDARSVSCDMYFSYSIMGNLLSSGRVLSEENSARISRLLERGRNMSLNTSRCTDLRVNRFRLVDDVLEQLASDNGMWYNSRVSFINEEGYDASGISTNMYTEFYKQLPRHHLFEVGSGMGCLPVGSKKSEDLLFFKNIGKFILRTRAHERLIPPFTFPPVLFKYLVSPVDLDARHIASFSDVEVFDPQIAQTLRVILVSDVTDFYMDFSDVGEPDIMLTNENKQEYVRRKIVHLCIGSRIEALNAIREGFWDFASDINVSDTLHLFSSNNLMYLLCGANTISADQLLQFCTFERDWLQQFLSRVFREWERDHPAYLLRFLEYATGYPAIPPGSTSTQLRHPNGDLRSLNVYLSGNDARRLPEGHLCSFSISLPSVDASEFDTLKHSLELAMETIEFDGSASAY